MLILIAFIISVWLLIQTTPVQNFLVRQVAGKLSSDLNTTVRIDHVNFALFNSMLLRGALVLDRQHDTLLYAGEVKVNITDWFFFKDRIELKYIGLKDAMIHANRTDSVWNYDFLLDYFSSPAPVNSEKKNINLDLRTVELENLSLYQQDKWRGEDMRAAIKALTISADEINFNKRLIRIRTINLDEPFFSVYDYPGLRVRKPQPDDDDESIVNDTANLRWNPGKWNIAIRNFTITDGLFASDRKTERAPYASFDGNHILFQKINGKFSNCVLHQDTIRADVNLSTVERSGLHVRQLKADLTMHPEAMEFDNLYIKTNRSELNNFFAMRYNTFDDMGDFETKVRMEGRFSDAIVSSDDIAFFAPELKNWKKTIHINGTVKGTVDNLNGKNLVVQAGHDTYLKGNISMAGLPDIDRTYIDFEAENFRTTYNDAIAFIPQLKKLEQPRLDLLEYLRFRGNFTGFINDFVTYGSLETRLGTVITDLNMKLPENSLSSYSGNIRTKGFNVGSFIGNKSVGKIIFHGKVNGIGLKPSTVNARLDGNIELFEFNNYPYQAIAVKGKVTKSLFNGELISADPNMQLELNGLVDFSRKVPHFNFEALITKADLKKLNLIKDQIDFNGRFNLNFSGSNIDNFLGTARVFDASVFREGKKIAFDSLFVESKVIDSSKVITAVSNEFDAVLAGEFSLRELPAAVQSFLNKYYPSYIRPSNKIPTKEDFSFVITTKHVEEYIDLIHPSLAGFDNSTITGRINTRENLLDLNIDVPHFNFKNVAVHNLRLKAVGEHDRLRLDSEIGDVIVNDSLHFPSTTISVKSANDLSDVNIGTSASQALNSANISARVQTVPKGAKLIFNNSDFDINGKRWIIEKSGELVLLENLISANRVKLYSGLQEISITTSPGINAGTNDIRIQLQKLNIGDFTPYIVKSNRLEGSLTGVINITDPFGKLRVDMNAVTEEFRLDNDSIGKVALKAKYYHTLNEIDFEALADNKEYNFNAQGVYHLGDSSRKENLDVFTNLRNTNIKVLQKYLDGVFTDVNGHATGALRITGPSSNLDYIGSIHVSDATLRVKYTNVLYRIPFVNAELKEDRIDFGSAVFLDEKNNKAQITRGILYHNGFNDLSFDFAVNSKKLLVLSTNNDGGDSYFGNIIAKVNMTLSGPDDDLVMNIEGEPADSSSLYINTKSGKTSDQADYIVWKVYGREMETVRQAGESNFTVNLDVTANNYANMYVILDELTGDIIKATGRGNLKINASTNGEFNITGRYDIDRGNYNFNFESLLRKPFKLREGAGNYIQWTGDPDNATIKIDAEYEADNVRFSDLGRTGLQALAMGSSAAARFRGKVLVVASLTNQLLSPDIAFRIELPQNSELRNDEQTLRLLKYIQDDQNELHKQVAFLVVFNSFGPLQTSNQGGLANIAFEGILVGSISGVLSNTLSRQFSDVFQKIFNDKSIRVNFNAQLYSGTNVLMGSTGGSSVNYNAFNLDRTNLNLSVGKSLFNERLTFTFGSAADFGLTTQQLNATRNLPFLPDITAEWKITPEGRVLLTFFYRDSYNYLSTSGSRQNRSGASISFRREFEKAGELLRSRKKN